MSNYCTHTSDWWKNMVPCACCGAPYSDEDAEWIDKESTRSFNDSQLATIEKLKADTPEAE